MVAISISTKATDVGLGLAAAKSPTTCRYKTGKCLNPRSSKRNGQPHQLCLFHRDKANMIQRRFDRQKRQVARTKKVCDLPGQESPTSISMLDWSALMESSAVSPTGSTSSTMSSTSSSSLKPNNVLMFSPHSPDCGRIESGWTAFSAAKSAYFDEFVDIPLSMTCNQYYLSTDEIDFLCAAVLE